MTVILSEVKLKDLVLIGGGHSHVEVLRQLAMQPVAGLRVTLVSREMQTPYSGMLPGFIAGHYTWDDIHIDLAPLCSSAGVRLIAGTVDGLLPEERILHCAGRPPIRYDLLSINAGSSPSVGGITGADQIGIPVKPLDRFLPHWQALLQNLRGSTENNYSFVVVGGGAGGVELALSMRHRFAKVERLSNVDISLVTADCGLLTDHSEGARARLTKNLRAAEIKVHLNTRIAAAEKGRLLSDTGEEISADEVLWVTQATPNAWPSDAGLATDDEGFIRVNDCLQSVSHPEVFAAGDIAGMEGNPRPKSGVFAVRQGPVLAENLRRAACSQPLKRYAPQKHFLSLISTGGRYAVASRGEFAAQGVWLWYLKDWIDGRFMKKYRVDAHPMRPASARWHVRDPKSVASNENEMRCGGCGAKLGGDLLSRVLSRLRVSMPAEVVTGIGDDAALLRPVANTLEVQTIDGFRAMLDDPYLLGRIATEHSMNDIYAMGGVPRTALVWGQVPFGGEQQMEDDLFQMMSGIVDVLDESGASLVGGHSGEAAELGVGVAISGSVHEREVWRNNRVALGDLLVLTKPLGTGALLAANMRSQCRGTWLANAIASMRQSNRNALDVFRKFYVKSCTDISGFGLLAHAGQLARSANLSLEIWPETVPLLAGVADIVHGGIVSTLQVVNEKTLMSVEIGEFKRSDLRVRILLDPQTSGGLLAAVKADRAESCLADLKAAGFIDAAVIGRVRAARDDNNWAVLQKI